MIRSSRLTSYIYIVIAIVSLWNAGCSGKSANFNAVTLTADKPLIIAQGTVVHITATVANDTANAGVTWTAPAHGTLSAMTKRQSRIRRRRLQLVSPLATR